MTIYLARNVFRSTVSTSTSDWIKSHVPDMKDFDVFCMSQPATNFGINGLVELPLTLFSGHEMVEGQKKAVEGQLRYDSEFELTYSAHVIETYARMVLKSRQSSQIHVGWLDTNMISHLANFLDFVCYSPHEDLFLGLLKKELHNLSDDDLAVLKEQAKVLDVAHTVKFYEMISTFEKTILLSSLFGLAALPGIEGIVIPEPIAASLHGSTFLRFAQRKYASIPPHGLLFQNGRYIRELLLWKVAPWSQERLPLNEISLKLVDDDELAHTYGIDVDELMADT